jgi:hypothetical protein
LQDIEDWQGLIFGLSENQSLPILLNPSKPGHCERSKAIFFKNT